ncbi:MAG: GNAT family N-acetyltransferase [Flavobacteriales bacterium]|nr:GNAT family N-acetyltransferase [Flavobacteriales bacterium]MDG1780965.1 GNAT family N-acetyltransferase [Flavobacteriales bacterium]
MSKKLSMTLLSASDSEVIIPLISQLNPSLSEKEISSMQQRMFEMENYRCFGLYSDEKLVGVSSGWITLRFYSGLQLEVDNVIIDQTYHSNGFGKVLFKEIESWAKENKCESVELNTYVENRKSHKFYHMNGYSIFGYHFLKRLD